MLKTLPKKTSDIYLVFTLLLAIRNSQEFKNSDWQLMMALALRSRPEQKYCAWPSYRQLARDTGLDEITLKRAAKRLEDRGFIRRRTRANSSNRFFINVPLIRASAAAATNANAAKHNNHDEDCPFEQPVVTKGADLEGDDEGEF